MQNTGTWNSDFAVFLVVLMLLPLFITFLVQIFCSISSMMNDDSVVDSFRTATFNDVRTAALNKAAEGDRYARDWCTKYIFDLNENNFRSNTSNLSVPVSPQFSTKQNIMDDAVLALIAIGCKKTRAKEVVRSVCKIKKYNDVGRLVIDCTKRGL